MPASSPIGLDTVVRAASDPLAAAVGDEIALLSLPSGRYYGLNPSGARIWGRIQRPVRVRDLLAQQVEWYEVDEPECRDDLLGLLREMVDAGLIAVEPGADHDSGSTRGPTD